MRLAEVATFIRFVRDRLKPGESTSDGKWIYRAKEGSLFLDLEETKEFARVVDSLLKKHVPRDDLSKRSVESFLLDAMFDALDLRSKKSITFEWRLRKSLAVLQNRLVAPSEKFTCWVPIEGLKLGKRPGRFGGVVFERFGRRQMRLSPEQRKQLPSNRRNGKLLRAETWGKVCARVTVAARDWASAEVLAERRARQILDLLNLFTDLVPFCHGWLYLPGEAARAKRALPMKNQAGLLTASLAALDPLAEVSWKSLRETKRIARPFRLLDKLAESDRSRDIGSTIILSAAEWMGRATIERRREQSFLLYSIALETLLLPDTQAELSHRLKLRVAHLLGKTVTARKRIAKDMARLYQTRSKIVHAGSYEVTDDELWLLAGMVKGALFRILSSTQTRSMSRQQFSEWLDRNILR